MLFVCKFFIMQLTTEQTTLIVLKFNKTGSIPRVRREFEGSSQSEFHQIRKRFYSRFISLANNDGAILNRNKGNSGRKRTQRTPENIAVVRNIIEEDHQSSVRRNESNLHRSCFHRILKQDLHYHLYKNKTDKTSVTRSRLSEKKSFLCLATK